MPQDQESTEFTRLNEQKQSTLVMEFWDFLREHKKWWLVPLLISLTIYAAFLIVSISSGPTFIYKLF
jgi:hypothetical protein